MPAKRSRPAFWTRWCCSFPTPGYPTPCVCAHPRPRPWRSTPAIVSDPTVEPPSRAPLAKPIGLAEHSRMAAFLVKWLSIAYNAIRLIGSKRHKRNIAKSKAILDKLAGFTNDGQSLAYLRKIDPYVFEELALTLLESRGILVVRSRRYSGDGGFDGRFRWPGIGMCAVQCKRYGQSISPSHAKEFARLCAKTGQAGLFIHTGRTGDASQEALAPEGVFILSGSDLARCAREKTADPLALAIARKKRSRSRALPLKN